MSRWMILIIVLVLLGAGGFWFTSIPGTAVPAGEVSQARFQPGPFTITTEEFTIIDDSRGMAAYNDFPGAPQRTLNGEVWRPQGASGSGPLLVYSHGFMSFREEGLYLSRFLASHGYTVVAVDYPMSGYHAPDGPLMTDVVNQPGDISATIDAMLARNKDPDDPLFQRVDENQIAIAGVSLGALTSLLAGFHSRLLDERIDAVVSIAGPGSLFAGGFFARSDLPLLLVYAGADAIVPYEENAIHLQTLYPAATLVTLRGASHAGFAQPSATIMRFIDNPDRVGCRAVTGELGDIFSAGNDALIAQLGTRDEGIDIDGEISFCDKALPEKAMPAARQHMFTTLAVHAFLESQFNQNAASRQQALLYLRDLLAAENPSEVAVNAATVEIASGQLQQ